MLGIKTRDQKKSEMRNYIRGLPGVAEYMDMPLGTVKKKWRKWAESRQIGWPSLIEGRMYFRRSDLDKLHAAKQLVKG